MIDAGKLYHTLETEVPETFRERVMYWGTAIVFLFVMLGLAFQAVFLSIKRKLRGRLSRSDLS